MVSASRMPLGGRPTVPATRRSPTGSATSRKRWASTTPATSRLSRTSTAHSAGSRTSRERGFAKHEGFAAKHLPARDEKAMEINKADVAELVDARDLKSLDGNVVWVRVPPPAPLIGNVPRSA